MEVPPHKTQNKTLLQTNWSVDKCLDFEITEHISWFSEVCRKSNVHSCVHLLKDVTWEVQYH